MASGYQSRDFLLSICTHLFYTCLNNNNFMPLPIKMQLSKKKKRCNCHLYKGLCSSTPHKAELQSLCSNNIHLWVMVTPFWVQPHFLLCCCLVAVTSDPFEIPWTVAHQASMSMVFPKKEYWSGLPIPFPGDSSWPGIKPTSPALAGGFFTTEPPGYIL